MAYEWAGRLVIDRPIAEPLRDLLHEWTTTYLDGHDLVIFEPPASQKQTMTVNAAEYRDTLEDTEPRFFEVSREAILTDPRAWFGEYSEDGYGGWTTLISAIPSESTKTLVLGNLAALGLKRDKDPDSAWAVQRSGGIRLHAVGLNQSQFETGEWHVNAGFQLGRSDFRLIQDIDKPRSSYLIALQIEAPVDPTVIIGSGVIFEQVQPWAAQNLAVAQPWQTTIDAGQILGLVMPAWCINQHLSAPSGQQLRATPLTFVGNQANQRAVWEDIAQRRGRAGV